MTTVHDIGRVVVVEAYASEPGVLIPSHTHDILTAHATYVVSGSILMIGNGRRLEATAPAMILFDGDDLEWGHEIIATAPDTRILNIHRALRGQGDPDQAADDLL